MDVHIAAKVCFLFSNKRGVFSLQILTISNSANIAHDVASCFLSTMGFEQGRLIFTRAVENDAGTILM